MIFEFNVVENVIIFTLVLLGVDQFKKFILDFFTKRINSIDELPEHLRDVFALTEKQFENFTLKKGNPFFGVFYNFNFSKFKVDYTITFTNETQKSDLIYYLNKVESNYFDIIKPVIFLSYVILIIMSYLNFGHFFTVSTTWILYLVMSSFVMKRFFKNIYESRYDLLSSKDLLKEYYYSSTHSHVDPTLIKLINSEDLSFIVNVRFNNDVQNVNLAKFLKKHKLGIKDFSKIKNINFETFGHGTNNLYEFTFFKENEVVPFMKIVSKVEYNADFRIMIEEMFINSNLVR